METIFPEHIGYAGQFIVGYRKDPETEINPDTERVGCALLKRTYAINHISGSLSPSANLYPIYLTDEPFIPDPPEDDEDDSEDEEPEPVKYESDIVPFKPEGDIIVLGFNLPGLPAKVIVNGTSRLFLPIATAENDLFGWQPRYEGKRKIESGDFPDESDDYPLPPAFDPLTNTFDNKFYNGYYRDAREPTLASLPYLPGQALIQIERNGSINYSFQLRAESPVAACYIHTGQFPDEENCWNRFEIPMHMDTLVIEPEIHRCYTVWRGTWPFDNPGVSLSSAPEEAYRRLVVTSTA